MNGFARAFFAIAASALYELALIGINGCSAVIGAARWAGRRARS